MCLILYCVPSLAHMCPFFLHQMGARQPSTTTASSSTKCPCADIHLHSWRMRACVCLACSNTHCCPPTPLCMRSRGTSRPVITSRHRRAFSASSTCRRWTSDWTVSFIHRTPWKRLSLINEQLRGGGFIVWFEQTYCFVDCYTTFDISILSSSQCCLMHVHLKVSYRTYFHLLD